MPMLESNLPHHWVFSWKLPIIAPREQQATFARYIQTSIKKSWSHVNTVIEVEPSISRPPVLEIYGMIWLDIAGASPPHGLDIADLQTKIKRQARRVGWKIEDEEASAVLTLDLLSDKVKAGDWVYSSVGASSMASSYCGDLVRFMHLISYSDHSYNEVEAVGKRMELCTGESFSWMKYHRGRGLLPELDDVE